MIISTYIYISSVGVIAHCKAKIVLADIKEGEYNIDPKEIERLIIPKTKAIIPVDIAGMLADYDEIFEIIERKKNIFTPKKEHIKKN